MSFYKGSARNLKKFYFGEQTDPAYINQFQHPMNPSSAFQSNEINPCFTSFKILIS